MVSYLSKSGKKLFKPSLGSLNKIINGDNNKGYCLACGKKADAVEPDARSYVCSSCSESKVYGAEELMIMGLYH